MTIQNLLVMYCLLARQVPFDLSYKPATPRDEPSLQLTVYLNPKASVNFNLEMGE